MVRTKADRVYTKAVGGKSTVKKIVSSPKPSSSKVKKYSGGNPYHPRETPKWQKCITNFISTETNSEASSSKASSSKEDQDSDNEEIKENNEAD